MTLEALVGSQLVVGLPGTRLSEALARHLRAIHAGGVIAFERNFETPEQFQSLIACVHAALGREALVMVDHEGGRVIRFRRGLTQFPDALTVGGTHDADWVEGQGATEAKELRALGVQVNLAPCVDVLVAGSDPIIGTRAYGSDAQRVAALGAARIRGGQRQGMAMCAKHFPGLGAVPNDPHTHLPTVTLDWDAMRRVHLVPFVEAIKADVALVMSSHVCYPRLEPIPTTPATFSSRLMRGLLRDELGFGGVVVSDDLEMGALRDVCPIGEAAVRAVAAGHDLLLICADPGAQRAAFEALCRAYQAGRLSTCDLEQRVERIARLRVRVGLSSP